MGQNRAGSNLTVHFDLFFPVKFFLSVGSSHCVRSHLRCNKPCVFQEAYSACHQALSKARTRSVFLSCSGGRFNIRAEQECCHCSSAVMDSGWFLGFHGILHLALMIGYEVLIDRLNGTPPCLYRTKKTTAIAHLSMLRNIFQKQIDRTSRTDSFSQKCSKWAWFCPKVGMAYKFSHITVLLEPPFRDPLL